MLLPIHTRTNTLIDDEPITTNFTSSAEDIRNCVGYAAQFVWTGNSSSTATVVVQGSLDENDSSAVFTDITSINITGSNGSTLVNVERAMYTFVRFVFTQTGGSAGTIRGKISIKIQ